MLLSAVLITLRFGSQKPSAGSGDLLVGLLDVLHAHPLRWALVGLLIIYALYAFAASRLDLRYANPLWAAMGADGRLSTSQFQFLVWTPAVLYVFLALVIARFGSFTPAAPAGLHFVGIPSNILIALGLSLTTVVGAKGIAVSYQRRSNTPPSRVVANLNLGNLISDDSGLVDLTKVQMLAWTGVAVFGFIYEFVANANNYATCGVHTGDPKTFLCFPDIDTALMVLMGLGNGTYLGGKFINGGDSAGLVTSMTAVTSTNTLNLDLRGQNLQAGNLMVARLDDPVKAVGAAMTWATTAAQGTVPNPLVAGAKVIGAGDVVLVTGTVAGLSLTPQQVTVTANRATVTGVTLTRKGTPPAITVTVNGSELNNGTITVGGALIPVVSWQGTTATATIDNLTDAAKANRANVMVVVSVPPNQEIFNKPVDIG